MSSPPVILHLCGRTDVGLVREHNEDAFSVIDLGRQERPDVEGARQIELAPPGAILLVCDGMGGAAAGEVASSMAVESIFTTLTATAERPAEGEERVATFARRLREAAVLANQRVYEAAQADDARQGMGTTLTAVGVLDSDLIMAQVGDSRAYVLRDGHFTQVTRDQSLVNQLLEMGQITEEQARLFEHSNVILQAIGVQPEVEVLLSRVPLRRGDRLVVCSDGLTGVVTDEEMAAVVGGSDDPAEACRLLIEMARSGGGPDNITLIVARCDGQGLREPAVEDRVVYQRWRLDEPVEPPPPPPAARIEDLEPEPAEGDVSGAQSWLSAVLLVALALGGLIASLLVQRHSERVECTLGGPPGLAIFVDGHDTGARTAAGATKIHLPPGPRQLTLGSGVSPLAQTVQVQVGATCEVRFAAPR